MWYDMVCCRGLYKLGMSWFAHCVLADDQWCSQGLFRVLFGARGREGGQTSHIYVWAYVFACSFCFVSLLICWLFSWLIWPYTDEKFRIVIRSYKNTNVSFSPHFHDFFRGKYPEVFSYYTFKHFYVHFLCLSAHCKNRKTNILFLFKCVISSVLFEPKLYDPSSTWPQHILKMLKIKRAVHSSHQFFFGD